MTADLHVTTDPVAVTRRRLEQRLRSLAADVDGVTGSLIASLDGRPLAADFPDDDRRQAAAIVASSVGLGERLAELTGRGELREIVVRSTTGYVVIYAMGSTGALIVLATPTSNLAMLHHKVRLELPALQEAVGDGGLVEAIGATAP